MICGFSEKLFANILLCPLFCHVTWRCCSNRVPKGCFCLKWMFLRLIISFSESLDFIRILLQNIYRSCIFIFLSDFFESILELFYSGLEVRHTMTFFEFCTWLINITISTLLSILTAIFVFPKLVNHDLFLRIFSDFFEFILELFSSELEVRIPWLVLSFAPECRDWLMNKNFYNSVHFNCYFFSAQNFLTTNP